MMGTCAYPGCGRGFERKRSDARYCSDTCRAKASKDRARARREGAGRRTRGGAAAPAVLHGRHGEPELLAERLAAMEQRMAAAEAGVARAEADRTGWKKVRDQLQAALARGVGEPSSAEKIAAAVRAEVGPQFARLAKRLDGAEAAQASLREEFGKLRGSETPPKAADLMMVGKAVGKLATRVALIERDVSGFTREVAEVVGDEE